MEKDKVNAIERKREVTFEKLFDEDLDTMLCCGLDPNPPKLSFDYPGLKKYAESVGKRIDELTADETDPFIKLIED